MNEPAITARNISVTFLRRGTATRLRRSTLEPDAVHTLRDVSFEVRRGEAFGIIGPNGAGKSTLMRVIGQTMQPDAGELTVRGGTSTLLQLGVGFNPQLSGSRNIVLGLLATGLSLKQIEAIQDQIIEYSELGDAIHRPLSTYSRGMQSRLAFAIATFNEADILLVDEVLAVGDEGFKQKSLATMRQLLEDAGTIVMVSHSLGTVQEFCDRVMWLETGQVQQIGSPATVVGAYRDKHTLGNVRLVRATRSDVDQTSRPLNVRRPEPLDADLMRGNRKADEVRQFVDLQLPHPEKAAPRRARRLIERGWRFAKGHLISLEPPIDWPDPGDTAQHRALMAWEPVATLLMANNRTPDPRWAQAATAFAVDWSESYASVDTSHAWLPGATALRAARLGALVDLVARDPLSSDAGLAELTVLAQLHAWALDDPDRFDEGGSVGLQQIAAMFALTMSVPELPEATQLEHRARRRLHDFIKSSQARDGSWKNHTPSLHAAITEQLTTILDAGLTSDALVEKARNRSERALAWFVMPDGSLPAFGEATSFEASSWMTGAPRPSRGRIKQRWRTGPMRAAASAAAAGRVPPETAMVFHHGGYVVVRNQWPSEPRQSNASYVAMMAGRHSTRHKHADDLSLVWFDRGRHLLVDAGGHEGPMEESHQRFVTSARAHNTIEIDGVDQFPGEPYGSGAMHAGELGSLRYASARARFGGDLVVHRAVVVEPGAWLLVVDSMHDRGDVPHSYRQWFHVPSDLDAEEFGRGIHIAGAGTSLDATSLSGARPIPPVRGAIDPRQGWVSPTSNVVEPAWAFGWETGPDSSAGFATLLSFDGPPTEVATEFGGPRVAAVRFRVGGNLVDLAIDLRNDPPVTRA